VYFGCWDTPRLAAARFGEHGRHGVSEGEAVRVAITSIGSPSAERGHAHDDRGQVHDDRGQVHRRRGDIGQPLGEIAEQRQPAERRVGLHDADTADDGHGLDHERVDPRVVGAKAAQQQFTETSASQVWALRGPLFSCGLPPGQSEREAAEQLAQRGLLVGLGSSFDAPFHSIRLSFSGVEPSQARQAGRLWADWYLEGHRGIRGCHGED
jgi:hypothetical protein